MRRVVIVNPASASGRTAKRWRRIVAELERGGEAFDVLVTERSGHAIELVGSAIAAGARGFVILGGDGTLGEVVAGCIDPGGSAMLADDIELSMVHQGTGGDLARGLAIPKDEAGAIEAALTGTARRIDVGVATYVGVDGEATRGFVSTSNVGIGAEVVLRAEGWIKRLGPSASFAAATLASLARNRSRTVALSVDGAAPQQRDIVDIHICNNAWMGGGMHAAPSAVLDDGELDVVVIAAAGRAKLVRTFPKIYSGRHVEDPLVSVSRARTVAIGVPTGAAPQGVVLDGELVGETPAAYRVLPSAISVRC